MASSLPKYSYKGVECTFVETKVRLLEELKCPICLELVNQPVYTSCCNQLFCLKCIKRQQICPTCRQLVSKIIPDVGSTKVLKTFKVKCPNSSEGCEWQGDLGDAKEHLEKNCQYQEVKCSENCGEVMKRKFLENHTEYDCPHRVHMCPFCREWGMYKYVTTVHLVDCGDFPLPCPAGCGEKITRRNMKNHLSTECPEEYVSCKYTKFGCDTAVRRREKESHFSDDTFHLKKSIKSQESMFQSLGTMFQSSTHIRPDEIPLPFSFRPWLQNTPTCYPRPPWVVKLEGFEEKRNSKGCYNNPVYSHFGGYKMCLSVYPNGVGSVKGTHVTVFISLMKGDNDENLKFPFKGRIVVSLLNQLEDKKHLTTELWSPESNVPEDISGRVTTGERNKCCGNPQFILHKDLNYNPYRNCQYLKNDCLFFRVDKFECVF